MRFLRFELSAFGPFTEKHLDFSGGPPGGLHLVYGRNAAGKSTALRAISDLLFGIPPKSGDDHVHSYQNLRLRALLESASGERLLVQRLKRAKDSLRDEHDAPLDDVALRRMLGAVDRAMFERVFGLDHERLRDAGQALLEGGGDVGESLFDAGAGGHGVHRVLARLREEAERLFKARGGKQEIPQLIESYKAARERVRNGEHSPEAYLEQERELERHRRESEALSAQLSELRRERERCRLLQGALKSIAERDKLLARLAALGELPDLPADFAERREQAQAAMATHLANFERQDREIERLKQRLQTLDPPFQLLALGDETITTLREGIGSTKKALQDLPKVEASLADRRAEAQAVERQLNFDSSKLSGHNLHRPEEQRFRKLAAERGTRNERQRLARERLAQSELDYETQRARLLALAAPKQAEALERAVLFARQVGDVEASLATLRREREEVALLSRAELATLAPFNGSLAELCTLRVPASETIAHFERSFVELTAQAQRHSEALARSRERAAELSRELSAESGAGSVPSEEELERARKLRDQRFEELWEAGPERPKKGLPLFEAARARDYRGLVGSADGIADRLRREAARVAETARRKAELAQQIDEQQRLEKLKSELDSQRERLERDWASSWAEAGFEPVRPAEMRGWLARREHAVALVVKDRGLLDREGELRRQSEELRRELARALGELPAETPLAVAVAQAEDRLDRERRVAADRAALEQQIAEQEVRRAAARRELEASEREAAALEQELVQLIGALGFDSGTSAEAAEERLEALGELVRTREKTRDLERRIAGMKRDIEAFEAEVAALVAAHAPELAEHSAQRAAHELVRRFELGRRDAETLESLQSELAQREAERDEEKALADRAKRAAEALLAQAKTSDFRELPAIEMRVRAARELRAQIDTLELTLEETASGRGLLALLEDAGATDLARLSARIDELDASIEQLDEQRSQSIRRHQSVQAGLERSSDTTAVEAAQEERALGSALISRSERWAKLKLAELLLSREIERYREQNQGPVLRRADELFVRLTHGEYRGLRLGREERTLVTLRGSQEVTVDGLNEAARYHLYLALRLASLERYLEHAEPLPLVLDDVLIHFDEEGAKAALAVLGELAARQQVLLFTHHRHNIELAEKCGARERLFVHEL